MNKPVHDTDEELLARFVAGDQNSFTTIYERHWKDLFVISYRILQDEAVSKDVVQEVFVSLYEKGNRKQILNLRAYLYQSARLQCFMHLRAGKITARHLERLEQIKAKNEVEEALEATELEDFLKARIDALPEKCREVFCLSRFESMPNQQIAEHLKISQKTVENQITKALKTLRTSVEKIALLLF